MKRDETFIKLNRKILNWRWYEDGNTFRVFIHLLLTANVIDQDYRDITIPRGSLITSYGKLASELGMSVQNVRTALDHLKSTGEVTSKQHSKFSMISIVKYDLYQAKVTGNQQATNKQLTSNQQHIKNINNDKEKKEYIYTKPVENLPVENLECYGNLYLTPSQYDTLENMCGTWIVDYIDRVNEWLENNPIPKENHYAVMRKFIENDRK